MESATTHLTPEEVQSLLDGPAGKPSAGVAPDFNVSSHLSLILFMIMVTFFAFATMIIVFRIYTKALLLKSIKSEDCTPYFPCK